MSYKFQENIALPLVIEIIEKNVGKALIILKT